MIASIKRVNKELKKFGYNSTLIKGNGYYYFNGLEADLFLEQGIYINNISFLSVNDVIQIFKSKHEKAQTY